MNSPTKSPIVLKLDRELKTVGLLVIVLAVVLFAFTVKMYFVYLQIHEWGSIPARAYPDLLSFFKCVFLIALPCIATVCLMVGITVYLNGKRRDRQKL